jgi:hypothetical protein
MAITGCLFCSTASGKTETPGRTATAVSGQWPVGFQPSAMYSALKDVASSRLSIRRAQRLLPLDLRHRWVTEHRR